MKQLQSKVLLMDQLTDELVATLYNIYQTYFENVTLDIFKAHISYKNHLIILYDRMNTIQGFSTVKIFDDQFNHQPIKAVFTGDTIIHRKFWGEQELVRRFCFLCGQSAINLPTNGKIYWLLISKGYKTYRYLPTFTNHFYPNFIDGVPPTIKPLMDHFYQKLYPEEYQSEKMLLVFKKAIGNLKAGVGEIEPNRLKNPHVNYFAKLNPLHMQGVELTCLAELSEQNMKSIAREYFIKGKNNQNFN